MKCPKCKAKLKSATNFCYKCGEKLVQEVTEVNPLNDLETESPQKFREKLINEWKNLDTFCKVIAIGTLISAFVLFISLVSGNGSVILSLISTILFAITLLINKQKIKVKGKITHIITTIFACLILCSCILSLGNGGTENNIKYIWSDILLNETLPEIDLENAEVYANSYDRFSVTIEDFSGTDFNNYIGECKSKGFTIDAELEGSSYTAYNQEGYKLVLNFHDYDNSMSITLDKPIEMETISISNSELAKLLPTPKSTLGKIDSNTEETYSLYLGNTTINDYNEYVTECEKNGFTLNVEKTSKSFAAQNETGNKISVEYKGANVIFISISATKYKTEIEVVCVENWFFSTYDIKVYIDGNYENTINHGETGTYSFELLAGNHTLKIENSDDSDVSGNIDFEVTKNNKYQFKVNCYSDSIDIENTNEEVTTTESTTDTEDLAVVLEKTFPIEYAKRAVVVAMTNRQAVDVFKEDGNTYDTTKFHSYSDTTDYYMTIISEGTWTAKDDNTWHIDNMKMIINPHNSYLKISCEITYDGQNYIVSNGTKVIAAQSKYLDTNDSSKINVEELNPSESCPYLTVPFELIEDDRYSSSIESTETTEKETEEETTVDNSRKVYVTPYGEKYHYSKSCAGKNAREISEDDAEGIYDPCKKCT